jgi:hypothetical protein
LPLVLHDTAFSVSVKLRENLEQANLIRMKPGPA